MNAKFTEISAAADYIGPGAIEVPMYQTEITDHCSAPRHVFGQRIKQVPATGHPSRFFEETSIPSPAASAGFMDPRNLQPPIVSPTRVERSVPLKALVAQINYNLFDLELRQATERSLPTCRRRTWPTPWTVCCARMTSRSGMARIQVAELAHYGAIFRCVRADCGGWKHGKHRHNGKSIVDGLKSTVAQMLSNTSYGVRPTAIYANPVLLDLLDRELKAEFNTVLRTKTIEGRL